MDAEVNVKSHVEAVSEVRDRIVAHTATTNSTINSAVNTNLDENVTRAASILRTASGACIMMAITCIGLALLAALSLVGWLYGIWQNRSIRGMP